MKKIMFIPVMLILVLTVFSCGGSVEVSEEMTGFMSILDGSENGATLAIQTYGIDGLDVNMEMYTVSEPKVKDVQEKDGMTGYTMNVKQGMIDADYLVWWKDGKVQDVEDIYE